MPLLNTPFIGCPVKNIGVKDMKCRRSFKELLQTVKFCRDYL